MRYKSLIKSAHICRRTISVPPLWLLSLEPIFNRKIWLISVTTSAELYGDTFRSKSVDRDFGSVRRKYPPPPTSLMMYTCLMEIGNWRSLQICKSERHSASSSKHVEFNAHRIYTVGILKKRIALLDFLCDRKTTTTTVGSCISTVSHVQ